LATPRISGPRPVGCMPPRWRRATLITTPSRSARCRSGWRGRIPRGGIDQGLFTARITNQPMSTPTAIQMATMTTAAIVATRSACLMFSFAW